MNAQASQSYPIIQTVGFDGYLVTFGAGLTDDANRAALAFRAAIEQQAWEDVLETSTSLVSTFVRFDPLKTPHEDMQKRLDAFLSQTDWGQEPLAKGRRLWRVPTVFGGAGLASAAKAAGLSVANAITSISNTRVRVQTIGFAPGMPYLGALSEAWDIPRQTELTPRVPAGGLCVAIRQLVLFPVATPTGWRQIGQTAIKLFDPDADTPFLFKAGDEVIFEATDSIAPIENLPNGGVTCQPIEEDTEDAKAH